MPRQRLLPIATVFSIFLRLFQQSEVYIVPSLGAQHHSDHTQMRIKFLNAMDKIAHHHRADPKLKTLRESIMNAANPAAKYRNLGDQNDDMYSKYGFDMSAYSLKYAGCSAISTFSDELAQDVTTDSVYKTIENVVFRLCPSDTCDDFTAYGCFYNYGEYIVRLDTWMQLMKNYRQEKMTTYCNTCMSCVQNQGGGNKRNLDAHDPILSPSVPNSHHARRIDAQNDNDNQNDDAVTCEFYSSACDNYEYICWNLADDYVDYTKYFECTAVSVDNGSTTVYLGPHCTYDKGTIVIGVFSDYTCTDYIGDKYDVNSISGINFSETGLYEYYSTVCVSCDEITYNNRNRRNEENDNKNKDQNKYTNVCESFYTNAGQCDRFYTGSSNQSDEEEMNEQLMCHYIESVTTGAYDEHGFIYIDSEKYEQDNMVNEYANYAPIYQEVTFAQVVGIIFLSFCLLTLSIWNFLLYRTIHTRLPWVASSTPDNYYPTVRSPVQLSSPEVAVAGRIDLDDSYQLVT